MTRMTSTPTTSGHVLVLTLVVLIIAAIQCLLVYFNRYSMTPSPVMPAGPIGHHLHIGIKVRPMRGSHQSVDALQTTTCNSVDCAPAGGGPISGRKKAEGGAISDRGQAGGRATSGRGEANGRDTRKSAARDGAKKGMPESASAGDQSPIHLSSEIIHQSQRGARRQRLTA
eukprot:jgi/Botrbrau1/1134/Bobra.0162s0027.1